MVMLEIGDGTGALVLHASALMAGAEIEISPVGQDSHRSHVAILARPGTSTGPGGQPVHAAVYPSLPAGDWNLWQPDGAIAQTIRVTDGEVTEVRWAGQWSAAAKPA